MAAAGGHKNVVRILLAAGANPMDENQVGQQHKINPKLTS